jgi:hypothetical protein
MDSKIKISVLFDVEFYRQVSITTVFFFEEPIFLLQVDLCGVF